MSGERSYNWPEIAWYADRVLNDPDRPLTVEPDAEGIVPGIVWPVAGGE